MLPRPQNYFGRPLLKSWLTPWFTLAIFAEIFRCNFLLLMDVNEWMSYECSDEGTFSRNIHNSSNQKCKPGFRFMTIYCRRIFRYWISGGGGCQRFGGGGEWVTHWDLWSYLPKIVFNFFSTVIQSSEHLNFWVVANFSSRGGKTFWGGAKYFLLVLTYYIHDD